MRSIIESHNAIKKIFIGNPQLNDILNDIKDCREESNGETEPDCMLVVGDTGSGKTTLIDKYLSENPRVESESGSIIPILFTTLPPNATPITASEKLLSDLGDPFAFQQSKDPVELAKKVTLLLHQCQVELIIIDEFQHMIDRKQKAVLHSAADWLKILIVDSKIPVALFGMPYSTLILDANSQLNGRFELQHHLEPFRFKDKKHLVKYKTFLELLDQSLLFPNSSSLTSDDLMHRIYYFSKGNMRRIRKLINRASKYALEDGALRIELHHFEKAAPKVSRNACEHFNPFTESLSKLKIIEPDKDVGWENYLHTIDIDLDDSHISAAKRLENGFN